MYIFRANYLNYETNQYRNRYFEINERSFKNEIDVHVEAMRMAYLMKRSSEIFNAVFFEDIKEM